VAFVDVRWNDVWQSVKSVAAALVHGVNRACLNFDDHHCLPMNGQSCATLPNLGMMEVQIDRTLGNTS